MTARPVTDPRRWAAFHCFGVYGLLMDIHAFYEDLHGALQAGQLSVARYAARAVVVQTLAVRSLLSGGFPPDEDDPLADLFAGITEEDLTAALEVARAVVRAPDVATARVGAARLEEFLRRFERDLGYSDKAPSVRHPDGLFPALRLAREILTVNRAAGLPLALPAAWLPQQESAV